MKAFFGGMKTNANTSRSAPFCCWGAATRKRELGLELGSDAWAGMSTFPFVSRGMWKNLRPSAGKTVHKVQEKVVRGSNKRSHFGNAGRSHFGHRFPAQNGNANRLPLSRACIGSSLAFQRKPHSGHRFRSQNGNAFCFDFAVSRATFCSFCGRFWHSGNAGIFCARMHQWTKPRWRKFQQDSPVFIPWRLSK